MWPWSCYFQTLNRISKFNFPFISDLFYFSLASVIFSHYYITAHVTPISNVLTWLHWYDQLLTCLRYFFIAKIRKNSSSLSSFILRQHTHALKQFTLRSSSWSLQWNSCYYLLVICSFLWSRKHACTSIASLFFIILPNYSLYSCTPSTKWP